MRSQPLCVAWKKQLLAGELYDRAKASRQVVVAPFCALTACCGRATAQDVVDSGALSGLQLESVVYACQRHDQFLPDGSRCAFFIGDGALPVLSGAPHACSRTTHGPFRAWSGKHAKAKHNAAPL